MSYMNKWHSYASEELLAWLLEENYPSVRYDTLTESRQSGVASQAYNIAGRFCTELVRADGTILLSADQPSILHLLQNSEELEDGGYNPKNWRRRKSEVIPCLAGNLV